MWCSLTEQEGKLCVPCVTLLKEKLRTKFLTENSLPLSISVVFKLTGAKEQANKNSDV